MFALFFVRLVDWLVGWLVGWLVVVAVVLFVCLAGWLLLLFFVVVLNYKIDRGWPTQEQKTEECQFSD